MKRFLSLLLALSFFLPHQAVWAGGKAEKFELTVAQSAKVGEALDLTVKAIGKDGSVVTDYAGTIFIAVDKDTKATIPYVDGYTFVGGDQGQKTFSKGLSFSKEGTIEVAVVDIDDDKVEGSAKVNVSAGEAGTTTTGSEAVTISSPEDGTTVAKGPLNISGATKKNSKVQVFLNGTKSGDAQTDDKGTFTYAIKELTEDKNVISVKVLDGSDKVIGESPKVTVNTISNDGPAFKSVTFKEGKSVTVGTVLNVTVLAEPKLKEVSVTLGDSIEVLKETSTAGTYAGTVTAPSKAADTPMDVTLTAATGKKTVKTAAETLTTKDIPAPSFENIKTLTSSGKVVFTFGVANDNDSIAKFKFEYGTESGALSKEVVTFDKSKILASSGVTASGATSSGSSYSWYVSDLKDSGYFFKISALDAAGSVMSGAVSEVIPVDMTMFAAAKCTIANISGLKVVKSDDSSVISWDALTDAVSYNVYKKDATGKYVLIENVKGNSYTIQLAKGAVKYDDFAVKALCTDGATESPDYKEVTKVQTGPGKILAMLAIALGLGLIAVRRRLAFFRK